LGVVEPPYASLDPPEWGTICPPSLPDTSVRGGRGAKKQGQEGQYPGAGGQKNRSRRAKTQGQGQTREFATIQMSCAKSFGTDYNRADGTDYKSAPA